MKRFFKLPSYATAFTEVRHMDIFPGGAPEESKRGMKGKISGDPVEVMGLLSNT